MVEKRKIVHWEERRKKLKSDPLANAKPLTDFSIFEGAPDDWDVEEFIEMIYKEREKDKI